jgi:YVTN family beta-propeller protein
MPRFRRVLAATLAVLTFTPTAVLAQATKAGVVTTLEGNVTVTRVALPQPQPLKFKDDVFTLDKVTTGDRSIARMLLGGKAVVTVRERSTLTITEVPGKSTIDLDAGKIALAVAKDKMKPGELIEIRTQNAVAGVRGTVVVAEVSRATAQAGGGAPALVTTFYVLSGQVFGQQINAATGQLVGAPVQVSTLQAFRASGIAPASVTNIPPGQVAQIVSGLSSSRPQHVSGGGDNAASDTAMSQTVALANAITGAGPAGDTITGPTTTQPATESTSASNTPPILPGNEQIGGGTTSGLPAAHTEINAFTGSIPVLPASVPPLPINETTLATITSALETWNGPGPYGRINSSTISQSNPLPMVEVSGGATLALTNGVGLLEVRDSAVTPGAELVKISGTVTQTGTSAQPLVDLIGGSIDYGGGGSSLLNVSGGTITTGGALIRATGTTFLTPIGDPFISVGSSVTTGGPILDLASVLNLCGDGCDPVLSVAGSVTVSSGSAFRVNGGTLTAASLASACSGCGLLTINGPLLEIVSGGVTLEKLLNLASAADIVATLPANTPFVKLTGGSLTTLFDNALLTVTAAGQTGIALTAGPGTTLTLAGSLARLIGTSTVDTNPGIQLSGATVTSTSVNSLVEVLTASSSKGPVLSMTGGTLTTTQEALLAVNTGNFTINNSTSPGLNGAALQFSGGTVSLGAEMAFVHPSRILTLDRGLVSAVGTSITTGTNSGFTDPFFAVDGGGAVVVATSSPFVSLSGGSVTTQASENFMKIGNGITTATVTMTGGGSVLSLSNSPTLNIGASHLFKFDKANVSTSGSFYDISGSTLSLPTKILAALINGTVLTTTGTAAAFNLSNSIVTVDQLVITDGAANTYNLAGPALQLTSSTLTANRLGSDPGGSTDVMNFAPTVASLNVPFARLTSSTLNVNSTEEHDLFGLGDDSTVLTTFGVSVIASGTSTINLHGSLATFERLTSNATDPMVQLTNTTVNQTSTTDEHALILVETLSSLTMAGPMAKIVNSTLNLSESLFYGEEGNTVYTGTSLPFIDVSGSTITTPFDIVGLGASTSLDTAATLLKVSGGTVTTRNSARNTVQDTVSSGGTSPFGVTFSTTDFGSDGLRIFVTNSGSNTVAFRDEDSTSVSTVAVGTAPKGIALDAFNNHVFVANSGSANVTVLTASTGGVFSTVGVGSGPTGVAITPDTLKVYVTNFNDDTVTVLNNPFSGPITVSGSPISVGDGPQAVATAVRPNTGGTIFAYVVNKAGNSISFINTSTDAVTTTVSLNSGLASGLLAGTGPSAIAITPDGVRAYVANSTSNTVSVVDLATGAVVATLSGFSAPAGVAISRTGTRAYVTNSGNNTVTVINTGDNSIVTGTALSAAAGSSIAVGSGPLGIVLDPFDSETALVVNGGAGTVSIVDTNSGGSLLHVDSGTTFTSTATNPVIDLANATIRTGFSVVTTEGDLFLKSPLIVASNVTLESIGNILTLFRGDLTDQAASTSTSALLQFTGTSSVSSLAANIVSISGNAGSSATMTLKRPLWSSTSVPISAYFNFLRLGDGATLCAAVVCGGGLTTQLIQINGGAVTLSGASFFRMFSFAGQNATLVKLDNGLLLASNGATIAAGGAFADIRDGATVLVNGSEQLLAFVGASGSAVSNFVAIGPNSTSGGGSGSGVAPIVTLSAGLFHAGTTASALTFSAGNSTNLNSFISIFDGAVVSNTGGNFLSLDGSSSARLTMTAAGNFVSLATTNGTAAPPILTLGDSLMYSTFTTINSGNPASNTRTHVFIGDGATLNLTAAVPLMYLDLGTIVTTAGNILTVRRSPSSGSPSTLSLGSGTLLFADGTAANPVTITTGGTVGLSGNPCCSGIFIGQGASVSSTAAGAAIELDNTTFSTLNGGTWFHVSDNCSSCGDTFHATTLPSNVVLAGGLLDATDSSITALFSGVLVQRSNFTAGSASSPVVDIFNTTNKTYSFGSGSNVGSFFQATACGAACSASPANTTITLGGTLLRSSASSGVRTTYSTTGDFIRIAEGASLISTTGNPLVDSTHSTFNVGNSASTGAFRHFFLVRDLGGSTGSIAASAAIQGPLLDSLGDIFNVSAGFVEVNAGTSASRVFLTRTVNTAYLLDFSNSTVNLGTAINATSAGTGNLFEVNSHTGMSLNGPLANVVGGGATTAWNVDRLVYVDCGSGSPCSAGAGNPGLDTGGSASAAINFSSGFTGTHVVQQEMFRLTGFATTSELDSDAVGNLVGTDQPLRHSGTFFAGAGTSMSTNKVMRLDTALLEASAPILHLTASSTITSASHALELVNAAKLTASLSGDALFKLNASNLTITNGSLVSLGGSSFMSVIGNLLSLFNGSAASITNGGLVSVSGTSVFRLTGGSLVAFLGGTGTSTVNVTGTSGAGGTIVNTIPNLSGVPVLLKNGATAAQISVTSGFTAFSGGTPTFGSTGAALVVDGSSAKIKLGP